MTNSKIYTHPISRKKWKTLFFCKERAKFRAIWDQGYGERSRLSVNYSLCSYLMRKRLNAQDIVNLFRAFWRKHRIPATPAMFFELRHIIIPNVYKFVAPYLVIIEKKYSDQKRLAQARRRAKRKLERPRGLPNTTDRIVSYVTANGTVTARQVASALNLSPSSVSKQLTRCAAFIKVSYGKFELAAVAQ